MVVPEIVIPEEVKEFDEVAIMKVILATRPPPGETRLSIDGKLVALIDRLKPVIINFWM